MLVRNRMSKHPITVSPDAHVEEALRRMRQERIRRFPVVDKDGNLLGMVSDKDLLYAAPSPATSLSIYELHYLYSRITVEQVMTKNVITIEEDALVEDAARLMVDNKIGGLPVMRGDKLVGIITETDIFKVFMELMGARDSGVRITVIVPDEKGMLAKVAGAVASKGYNIISLGTFWGEDGVSTAMSFKVENVTKEELLEVVTPLVLEVTDIRDT